MSQLLRYSSKIQLKIKKREPLRHVRLPTIVHHFQITSSSLNYFANVTLNEEYTKDNVR